MRLKLLNELSMIWRQWQRRTRHRASKSTRWQFAFGTMLSWQRNVCTDCKSTQRCTTRGHPYYFSAYIRVRAVQ